MHAMPWMGFAVNVNSVKAAGLNPIFVLAAFIVCTLVAYAIYRSVSVESRPASIWNCGEVLTNDEVRYRASSFYKPFRNLISPVYRKFGLPQIPPPQP